ncbi:MAG: monovalent cation/H(+) antiporter subunit G [Anaerolineales bacterium]|nr:monovalent cation/H(+) antiporter subunit G [Anaerolineales bacterium]QYK51674.1 MAG: monovalent cation/H(+) antiporter subunit G [Anaerolineales bacterium]
MELREIITLIAAGIGVLIMLISSAGVLNLPDVFMRMHGFGKASTLGISGLMLAAGVYYPDYFARMMVLVVLFFITGPIATTALTRAAYKVASPSAKLSLRFNEMESGPRRARKPAKRKKKSR